MPNDGLRAVNVYAITTADGVVLIDSGWALAEARGLLEASLAEIGHDFSTVRRFLVTHAHRDHYTMAVELRRTFGTRVALGIGEQPSVQAILDGRIDGQFADLVRWGARDIAEQLRPVTEKLKSSAADAGYELPDEWIPGAVDIEVGDRVLRAVPTPGHTAGHVVFIDPAASLMFSGDHVLPHITPSIGFEVVRARQPLADYLDSLRLVRGYPDMRMLPAHGDVGPSVHARVDELLAHHEDRLGATLDAVTEGAVTAFDTARALKWTGRGRAFAELDLFNQVLAVGETSAHLDLLVLRGELKSTSEDGVDEYAVPK